MFVSVHFYDSSNNPLPGLSVATLLSKYIDRNGVALTPKPTVTDVGNGGYICEVPEAHYLVGAILLFDGGATASPRFQLRVASPDGLTAWFYLDSTATTLFAGGGGMPVWSLYSSTSGARTPPAILGPLAGNAIYAAVIPAADLAVGIAARVVSPVGAEPRDYTATFTADTQSATSSPFSSTTPPLTTGGTGAPRRAEEIKLLVPPWMETRYPSLIGAILHAFGCSDHQVVVGDRTLFVRGTNPAGNVLYVAKVDDATIRVKHLRAATGPVALALSVTGKDILVTLGLDAGGNVSTTAAELRAAIEANPSTNALVSLTTFGSADQTVGSFKEFIPLDPDGIEGARRDLLLDFARADDLSTIGNNYGIAKPLLLGLTDDQFRSYIAALAFRKKGSRASIEALLSIIFGNRASAGWAVYESLRKRTITIEVTETLLPSGPSGATYLRTIGEPPALPNSTLSFTGDYLRPSAASPFVPNVKIRPGDITSTPLSAISTIPNNSVYLSSRGANRDVLLNVMKLVRAAGVRVEFVQKRG